MGRCKFKLLHPTAKENLLIRLNSKVGDGTIASQTDETLVAQPKCVYYG